MSFRGGRGRGRGGGRFGRGGGGNFNRGKEDTWQPFPENEELGTAAGVVEKLHLARYYTKLQSYWKSSPYYYEGNVDQSKKPKSADIERFSDKISDKSKTKPPLSHYINMVLPNVPRELARGGNIAQRSNKKVRWDPNIAIDLSRLDTIEEQEKKYEGRAEKKKEEDEEDEDKLEEEGQSDSDNGDYDPKDDNQDDEDDYNPVDDDNGDEPVYDDE